MTVHSPPVKHAPARFIGLLAATGLSAAATAATGPIAARLRDRTSS